jgi:hypothetical protein
VIMKTDPGRVAYTCARCGAIAIVSDLEPGPEHGTCRAVAQPVGHNTRA